MPRRIAIIQGHPDAGERHLCHALADAYADGAESAGHAVRRIDVGTIDFPLLRSGRDWEDGTVPPVLAPAQATIGWCEHAVLVFPLWMGDMPALLKGFIEQVARPGFAVNRGGYNPRAPKALAGRSARVVVTMGMPALVYRFYFRAHSVRSLERNILGMMGFAPIDETLIGLVGTLGEAGAGRWLARMRAFGRAGE